MSNRFAKYADQSSPASGNRFAKYAPGVTPQTTDQPKSRGAGGLIGDSWDSFAGGANILLKMGGDLYGLTTGDMDNWASKQGQRGIEYWNERKSDYLKNLEQQRKDKVNSADGQLAKAGTALWQTIKSPSLISSFMFEQVPMLLPIAGVGGTATRVGTKAALARAGAPTAAAARTGGRIGTGAAVGTGAAMQGSDAGSQSYEQLMALPDPVWELDEEYQALRAKGVEPEQAKKILAVNLSRNSAIASGIASVGLNLLPGARILEKSLAGAKLPGNSRAKNAIRGFFGEAFQEGAEEGSGVYLANRATAAVDPNQDLMEGVGEATGMGAAFGPFGAVAGALNSTVDDVVNEVTDPEVSIDDTLAAADELLGATDINAMQDEMLDDAQDVYQYIPGYVDFERDLGLDLEAEANYDTLTPETQIPDGINMDEPPVLDAGLESQYQEERRLGRYEGGINYSPATEFNGAAFRQNYDRLRSQYSKLLGEMDNAPDDATWEQMNNRREAMEGRLVGMAMRLQQEGIAAPDWTTTPAAPQSEPTLSPEPVTRLGEFTEGGIDFESPEKALAMIDPALREDVRLEQENDVTLEESEADIKSRGEWRELKRVLASGPGLNIDEMQREGVLDGPAKGFQPDLFRKQGGLTIDGALEYLNQSGDFGFTDKNELIDALTNSVQGREDVYGPLGMELQSLRQQRENEEIEHQRFDSGDWELEAMDEAYEPRSSVYERFIADEMRKAVDAGMPEEQAVAIIQQYAEQQDDWGAAWYFRGYANASEQEGQGLQSGNGDGELQSPAPDGERGQDNIPWERGLEGAESEEALGLEPTTPSPSNPPVSAPAEAELVDDADPLERMRADVAGEPEDRATMIMLRNILDDATDIMNDGQGLSSDASSQAIELSKEIDSALESGDISGARELAAARLQEWFANGDVEDVSLVEPFQAIEGALRSQGAIPDNPSQATGNADPEQIEQSDPANNTLNKFPGNDWVKFHSKNPDAWLAERLDVLTGTDSDGNKFSYYADPATKRPLTDAQLQAEIDPGRDNKSQQYEEFKAIRFDGKSPAEAMQGHQYGESEPQQVDLSNSISGNPFQEQERDTERQQQQAEAISKEDQELAAAEQEEYERRAEPVRRAIANANGTAEQKKQDFDADGIVMRWAKPGYYKKDGSLNGFGRKAADGKALIEVSDGMGNKIGDVLADSEVPPVDGEYGNLRFKVVQQPGEKPSREPGTGVSAVDNEGAEDLIEQAANEAATSPANDTPEPTQAQIEAGNYKKGHARFQGLDVTIENPKGSTRSGNRDDGSYWENTLTHHYGYIKRTTGADGEHVDVFIGPDTESDKVFIIDQQDEKGGFDEHKVMLGFNSKLAAKKGYKSNYDKDWTVGPVTEMSMAEFEDWVENGDTTQPLAETLAENAQENQPDTDNGNPRQGRQGQGVANSFATPNDMMRFAMDNREATLMGRFNYNGQEGDYYFTDKESGERLTDEELATEVSTDPEVIKRREAEREALEQQQAEANAKREAERAKRRRSVVKANRNQQTHQSSANRHWGSKDKANTILKSRGLAGTHTVARAPDVDGKRGWRIVALPDVSSKVDGKWQDWPYARFNRNGETVFMVKPESLSSAETQLWLADADGGRAVMAPKWVDSESAVESQGQIKAGDSVVIINEGRFQNRMELASMATGERLEYMGEEFPDIYRGSAAARNDKSPEPLPQEKPGWGSKNTVFTEDAAEKARALLKSKLNQLNSGIDPEMLQAGITLAGYHIEAGARKFGDFAAAMVEDLGEEIRPYLRTLYESVRYYPDFDSQGMSSQQEIEAYEPPASTEPETDAVEPAPEPQNVEDQPSGGQEPSDIDKLVGALGNLATAMTNQANGSQVARNPAQEDNATDDSISNQTEDQRDGSGADTGVSGDLFSSDGPAGGTAAGSTVSADGGERPGATDGVPGSSASASRKPSDKPGNPLRPGATGGAAGNPLSDGSTPSSTGGLFPAESQAQKAGKGAQKAPAVKKLQPLTGKVKQADRSQILEEMPFLTDGQADDVVFAEKRFSKADGYGVLFTNGTGTGKTFSGMGIVRRFVNQGKDNILVVVPKQTIADAWIKAGQRFFDVPIKRLDNTRDNGGSGVVITTYANMQENPELSHREWDLLVADESHYLTQAQKGTETKALDNFRALASHDAYQLGRLKNWELVEKIEALNEQIKKEGKKAFGRAGVLEEERSRLNDQLDEAINKERERVDAMEPREKSRAVMLSATPFAYDKSVVIGQHFLFDWNSGNEDNNGLGYNSGGNYERFMMEHFGYRMRYNKLTKPEGQVDSTLMERNFNLWLKKQGVLSGRKLDEEFDYDRRFQSIESNLGNRVDEALEWFRDSEKYEGNDDMVRAMYEVGEFVRKRSFDYHARMYFLEAIKAREAIPYIQSHLDAGRKVVVMHDFKKGGTANPFATNLISDNNENFTDEQKQVWKDFQAEFSDLARSFDYLPSVVNGLSKAFPDAMVYNGDFTDKKRVKMQDNFNTDAPGSPNLIVAQGDAMREGVSIHDTTGKHQRVLIHLGMPVKPTAAIQQEGRIYRTGQASDAIFRYFTIGTNWERYAFADKIAGRAGTAENLAMGEEARGLRQAFIDAFEAADNYPVGMEGEGQGGKEADRAMAAVLTRWDQAKSFYFGSKKQGKGRAARGREGDDYFATPEPLGLKMVEWADIRPGEDVLEPSAGHGAIARWFPENTNTRRAIEPSSELGSKLALRMDGDIVTDTFEDHNIVNKYDAIVMNPPFGSGGSTAVNHLAKAYDHLREGGRVVALIPTGPAADKKFDKWFYEEDSKGRMVRPEAQLVAEISLPGVTFERAGTAVATRIMVIEKWPTDKGSHQASTRSLTYAEDINTLFDNLEDMEIPPRMLPLADMAEEKPESTKKSSQKNPDRPPVESASSMTREDFESWMDENTRTGAEMVMLKAKGRLERDDYKTINNHVRSHGGYWSRFKKGWHFPNEAAREEFLKEIEGDSVQEPGNVVYSVSDGQPNDLQRQDRVESSSEEEGGTGDLFAPGNVSSDTAKDQSADNFILRYESVEVGQLRSADEQIKTPEQAAHLFAPLRKHAQETFMVLVTDKDHKPLHVIRHTKGVKDASNVSPVELVGAVASTEGAKHVWFAHNHPSGEAKASDPDIRITSKLLDTMDGMNIKSMGHVIVTTDRKYAYFNNAGDEQARFIKPKLRKRTVPVTERILRKSGKVGGSITNSESAIRKMRSLQADNAIVLLNNKSAVVGSVAMTPKEMAKLREGGRVVRLLSALDKTNANGVIIKTSDGAPVGPINTAKFFNSLPEVRVLDWIFKDGNEFRSSRSLGYSVHESRGIFFHANQEKIRKGIGKKAVEEAIADTVLQWQSGPEINVVGSKSELPRAIRDEIDAFGGEVSGLIDSDTDAIYLVADQIDSAERAQAVLAHEAIGHFAFDREFAQELGDIYNKLDFLKSRDKTVREIASEVENTYRNRSKIDQSAEIVARMAERNVKSPILVRVYAALRRFLRRLGFNLQFKKADLDGMLIQARDSLYRRSRRSSRAGGYRFGANNDSPTGDLFAAPDSEESGGTPASENPRVEMDFKQVTRRIPELTEAAQRLKSGDITREEYAAIQEKYKPVSPYETVPVPNTEQQIVAALTRDKKGRYGEPMRTLEKGHKVGIRLDIPAYRDHGVWAVSVHEFGSGFAAGKSIGYESVSRARNVTLGTHENASLNIASGKPKGTIAVMKGEWVPTTPAEAEQMALDVLNDPDWIQVGMDPERHSYFYDRATMEPVVSADEVIQVGPLSLAKNPVYEEKSQFLFSATPDPKLEEIADKVLAKPVRHPIRERIRRTINMHTDDWRLWAKQGGVDQFASIADMEIKLFGALRDASDSSYKAAAFSKNSGTVLETAMHAGAVKYVDGGLELIEDSEGLMDILGDLADQGMVREWELWAGAVRASRLIKEGKEKNYTQDDIDTVLQAVTGEKLALFKDVHERWTRYNKQILDLAQAAGLINAEQRKQWAKDDYVPFHRVSEIMDEMAINSDVRRGGGLEGQRSNIKQLSGGVEKISIVESMVRNTAHLIDASMKNIAMQRTIEMAEEFGTVEKVQDASISEEEARERLDQHGIEYNQDDFNIWKNLLERHDARHGTVTVAQDGKVRRYVVHDPLLLRAMTSLGPTGVEGIMKFLRIPKRLLTEMVTADPSFAARNLIRDTLSTHVTVHGVKRNPLADAIAGVKKAYKNDASIQALRAQGVGGGGFYDVSPEGARDYLDKLAGEGKVITSAMDLWNEWRKLLGTTENANRIAVYEAALKEGKSKAEAAYQAMDVLNFSRHGEWKAMRIIIELVPFMNARIQGLDRLYRGAKEGTDEWHQFNKDFMLKGAVLTGATLALLASNWDNDDYWDLPEWERDTYYHVWVGSTHLRIPKPFEVGALFSTVPERMFEQMRADADLKLFGGRMLRMMLDTFALDPTPQFVRPALEVGRNKSGFTGRDILTMGMEFAAPEAQYTPYTSKTMIEMAEAMPDWMPEWARSPARLEHLFEGYFGTLGRYGLMSTDMLVRGFTDSPARPEPRLMDVPVVQSFIRDGQNSNKQVGRVYEMARDVNEIYTAIMKYREEGRTDQARRLMNENRGRLRTRATLNRATNGMGRVSATMRQIYDNKDMSPQEKRRRLDELTRRRNEYAKQIEERVRGYF